MKAPRFPAPERHLLEPIRGSWGWPVIGNSLHVIRDEIGFWRKNFGDSFAPYRTHVFGEASISFAGPEAAQALLTDPHKVLSSAGGWDHTLGQHFGNGLMLRDFDDHRAHRKLMQSAFSRSAVRGYVDLLDAFHSKTINALGAGPIDPWVALKEPLLDTATRLFLGERDASVDEVNHAFLDTLACVGALVRAPLPGTAWARANRGRTRLEAAYRLQIERRRQAPGDDLLSQLVALSDEPGGLLDDDTIVDHLIFLMMAAHDTTNSALSSALIYLALHPGWQEQVREEALQLDAMTPQTIADCSVLDQVIKETLRLAPPVIAIPRRTIRACTLAGLDVPANAQVWINIVMTHRLPSIWTDPDGFDPGRFSPERAEHRSHRYAYVPFGAGAHTCLGLSFAELSMKVFLLRLLKRAHLEVPADWSPRWRFLPFPRVDGPVPLRLSPLR